MKNQNKSYFAVFSVFFILLFPIFVSGDKNEGKERLDVKTLLDKESSQIKFNPIRTTVKSITTLIQPYPNDKKFNKNIRFGYEFNVYQITCRVREFKKDDNGNYRLVVVDINDTTCTMIGEIPCSETTQSSNYKSSFAITRDDFENVKLPNNKILSGVYVISGVCFFAHEQIGGVELNPIMDFSRISKF